MPSGYLDPCPQCMHARSISSSSSSTFPASPVIPQSPTPEPDHMSSLLAIFPPVFGKSPSSPSVQLYSLPRAFKDETGQKQQPGLKDLPLWLRENFRNLYIWRIIEWVGLSDQPWNNPCVASLEQEFYRVYSAHQISSDDGAAMPLRSARQIRLHSDDAVVVPVSSDILVILVSVFSQTLRPFETLGLSGTKLGMKDSLRPSNIYQGNILSECLNRGMCERDMSWRLSTAPNVPSYGNISTQELSHSPTSRGFMTRCI